MNPSLSRSPAFLASGIVAAATALTALADFSDREASPGRQDQLGRLLFFDPSLSTPANPAPAATTPPVPSPIRMLQGPPQRECIRSASAAATHPQPCTWPTRPPSTSTRRRGTTWAASSGTAARRRWRNRPKAPSSILSRWLILTRGQLCIRCAGRPMQSSSTASMARAPWMTSSRPTS